jgi:two-component system, sensor histidine kinase RegB
MARLDPKTQRMNLAWLVQLRWGAVIGQLGAVLFVHYGMRIALPLLALLIVISAEALSNVACSVWAKRSELVGDGVLGAMMAFDVVLLTALLFLSGGPFNPFSFLYLVHIALSAVVLPPRWTWSLVVFSLACFGLLFVDSDFLPADIQIHMSHLDQMRMHMQGMWLAFGVAAVFISYFVTRVRHGLSEREAELSKARQLALQGEKLVSLATLATGAAHELSTPLSTIAVIAKELQRVEAATADAQLIRREVDRCRDILQRMAADGEHSGDEAFEQVTLTALIESALDGLPGRERVRFVQPETSSQCSVRAQPQAMAQALRTLIKNALQASPAGAEVLLDAALHGEQCVLTVKDRGAGMSDEVLSRAGEPFFTTKEPGEGMGLGLFLARIIAERGGGRLSLESQVGQGTTATLRLPVRQRVTG